MQRESTVLLADDCAEALDVIEAELVALGFRVVKANDGAEAWARFQSAPPDLVVTEAMIPSIVSGLRDNGDRRTFLEAAKLVE